MALIFDEIDLADIETATNEGGKIWYNPALERLKTKIKDHYILNNTSKCCYCSRLFHGEFRMVIDIEHILPQAHFTSERFSIQNLNVACKRCNMGIKKDDRTFIHTSLTIRDFYNSVHYKFIHPNLDVYTNHLLLKTIRIGDSIFNKYIIKNQEKGLFTYEYFELKKLEIDTINKLQGIEETKNLSLKIKGALRNTLLKLITKI